MSHAASFGMAVSTIAESRLYRGMAPLPHNREVDAHERVAFRIVA